MRNRLSGLTVIGITTFSALKRAPGCSDPSDCSVYRPMSPSSAFETYTKVAALAWALKSKEEAAMRIAALKFPRIACPPPERKRQSIPFYALGGAGGRLPGWQSVEGSMWSQGRALAVQMLVAIFRPLESSSEPARTTRNPGSGLRWL